MPVGEPRLERVWCLGERSEADLSPQRPLVGRDSTQAQHIDDSPKYEIARLDKNRTLMWIATLTDSNPFEMAEVHASTATFTNNLGNSLTVDLDHPDFA
jgi:hypothetical protein